ncbi:MAG: PAS domain S-box protein [Chloroflexi bacterium]|nr:MAG: PAS domain S-box protein [Chloroflexota bacterium]
MTAVECGGGRAGTGRFCRRKIFSNTTRFGATFIPLLLPFWIDFGAGAATGRDNAEIVRAGTDNLLLLVLLVLLAVAGWIVAGFLAWKFTRASGRAVTGHRQAELQLKRSEERFRRAVMDAPFPIMIHAEDGRVVQINRVWTELTGYTPQEIPTIADWTEKAYGQRANLVRADIDRLYGLDSRIDEGEYFICTKFDETLVWHFSSIPLGEDAGGQRLVLSAATDVTQRKSDEEALKNYSEQLTDMVVRRTKELRAAQEELVRKEKLATLGQLAGSVGHELRNPLAVITNAVYFLKMMPAAADETVAEYLEIINSETHKAEKIVSDLLNFSRKWIANRRPASAKDLVQTTLAAVPPPEDISVQTQIAENLPAVLVDAQQMEQVLTNLLTNAYQAISGPGQVTVSARPNNGSVVVAVADTGSGISAENMKKIFEPLFTTKARGIGLGLVVTKNLVEANGGEISVCSVENQGTTFTISLPAVENQP